MKRIVTTATTMRRGAGSLLLLQALSSSSWALQLPLPLPAASRPALEHLRGGLFRSATPQLEALTNARIPRSDGGELLAHVATPKGAPGGQGGQGGGTVILLHEFFGLSASIVEKADALAEDLGCVVIAPDMFRGETSSFIPRVRGARAGPRRTPHPPKPPPRHHLPAPQCIWLALSTPTERVCDDLDDVWRWGKEREAGPLAVMGYCFGGGKAIRYTTARQPSAATVVCYGEVEDFGGPNPAPPTPPPPPLSPPPPQARPSRTWRRCAAWPQPGARGFAASGARTTSSFPPACETNGRRPSTRRASRPI